MLAVVLLEATRREGLEGGYQGWGSGRGAWLMGLYCVFLFLCSSFFYEEAECTFTVASDTCVLTLLYRQQSEEEWDETW